MSLIYRTNSLNKRTKGTKAKPPPKAPKFPKNAVRNKDGTLKVIGTPYGATLGTAHVNNRFNENFGVNPATLPRSESMPNLNQWVKQALAAISYNSTKAHDLTRKVVSPQRGWTRTKQRIHFRGRNALPHALKKIADMFKQLRENYMASTASLIVDCLEESDLPWQNVLEPLTGVMQAISEVMFRGYTDLPIHRIDGLKLARSIRIIGEELDVTAVMLDSMLGLAVTRWTARTVVMARETAQQWRATTITRMGLEDIYNPLAPDEETDTVDVNWAKLWVKKFNTPGLPGETQSSQKESTPTDKAKNGGPEVQEKDAAAPSSSSNKPLLKKAPKETRTSGPSVDLPQKNVSRKMELALPAREKEYQELEDREYSERSAVRAALESLKDDDGLVPTGSNRAYRAQRAARYSRQQHNGLQMNDQDMELDPLRMAQIRGVSDTGSYLSYAAFPSAHLTDNRTNTEIAPVRSDRHRKREKGKDGDRKVEKGKAIERRSVLKKPAAEILEDIRQNGELTPKQIASSLGGIKNPEVLVQFMQSNEHIATQIKGNAVASPQNSVEIQAHPTRTEIKRPSTSDHAKSTTEGLTKSKSAYQQEDGSIRVHTDENKRPRVRFEEASLPAGDGRDSRAYREAHANRVRSRRIGDATATSGRTSREDSTSGSSSRTVGESHSSPSETRSSTITRRTSRNAGETGGTPNGRFIRVGNDVIPAPLKIRQTRSQSPLLGKSSAGSSRDSNLVPAPLKLGHKLKAQFENRSLGISEDLSDRLIPLKLGQTRSESPYQNRGVGVPEGLNAMPAPLKLNQKKSQSPLESRGAEFPEGLSAMPAPLKLSKTKSKSPLENRGTEFPAGPSTMLAPPKLGHKRARFPLENRGVGFHGGSIDSFPSAAELARFRAQQPGPPPDRPLPPLPTNFE
ncbi:hypothetical protein VE02_04589 [Pseudogymnoascus sp. 03VT05]|nr:hypothetical protein VE02_04589 [Pseudogymnoascus sp. 03VT05]